ncbi:atypical chemokine receptor 3b [Xyrichtys novacula]|uniref:Atypical chemokine receptor 3b n=1 Tax=Xyrichtys novacula TaxID=13765 RepID=A0AAV1HLQ1_XYRNO|nr:atypical chemokine receptor 3b [Xyrichtys novacula]
MSLSVSDLSQLVELWEELNLTAADHMNVSRVETLHCSGAVSHASFLTVLSVFYIFIFLVGLGATAAVIWVSVCCNRKYSGIHVYVLHLAVADLCVVSTLPVWVASLLQGGRWLFGDAVCKLTHLIFSVNLFSSIFFLVCMSVDRYLSVTQLATAPHSQRKKVQQLICILMWLLALVASIPDTYFLQAVRSSHMDGIICRPVFPPDRQREWMVGVQLSFIILGFAVPFPVITFFYLRLAAVVPPGSDRERQSARRIILSYIMVFVACWLPFHAVLLLDTLSLLQLLPFSCRLENFLFVSLQLTQCCSLVHCCCNPALYGLLHRHDRYQVMKAVIFRYSTKTGLIRLISPALNSESSTALTDNSAPV